MPPPMMRRTREPELARERAPRPRHARASSCAFCVFLRLEPTQSRCLPPFGAQAYASAPIRQVRRIVLHDEGMRPD
jgi:hypothetical protein